MSPVEQSDGNVGRELKGFVTGLQCVKFQVEVDSNLQTNDALVTLYILALLPGNIISWLY